MWAGALGFGGSCPCACCLLFLLPVVCCMVNAVDRYSRPVTRLRRKTAAPHQCSFCFSQETDKNVCVFLSVSERRHASVAFFFLPFFVGLLSLVMLCYPTIIQRSPLFPLNLFTMISEHRRVAPALLSTQR